MHSTLPGSCTLHERHELNCAAPGRPQDSVPPSPVSPTLLPALDLGEKEESSITSGRERRAGWDLNTIKAQMLGLSTATLGWSRCLQRTQSLFFFSFFSLFSPLKSFNRVWRRKENLKAIIFYWLFDAPLLQCRARDGDRAGMFVSPFLASFWAGRGGAVTAAAREH